MKEILELLFNHQVLTKTQAKEVLTSIGTGQQSEPEIAAFLAAYRMRKITAAELSGFREAMLDLCVPVNLSDYDTIDVVGTGGDEKNTFNISTTAGFVLAGAGVKVIKHGNVGVSSNCGASNLMESLGYKFSNDVLKIRTEIEKANFSYLHAPLFHPAMKHVAPVRKALKVKTFFNILGPLVNPSKPRKKILGVYNEEFLELYNQVYKDLSMNYYVVYSLDGYDEISLTGDFKAITMNENKIFSPKGLGLPQVSPEDLSGGETVADSVKIFKGIIEGKGTEGQKNVIIANAAFGLRCYYPQKTIRECVEMAKESLNSGKAYTCLKTLIDLQK